MKKNGQIWIETVLYTLIGLALIGVVLAFMTPKINETKDRAVIEQTINALNVMDEKINIVLESGVSNKRPVDFSIRRGELYVDSLNDKIIFVINDLTKPYSELDSEVQSGRLTILTTKGQKYYSVNLTLSYQNVADITTGSENEKKFGPTSIPYKIFVENTGSESGLNKVEVSVQ